VTTLSSPAHESTDPATATLTPPEAPELLSAEATSHGVRLAWSATDGVWVTVLRRDVVGGGEPLMISPWSSASDYLDSDVEAGRVYAYSIRGARFVEDTPIEGASGAERYVEAP